MKYLFLLILSLIFVVNSCIAKELVITHVKPENSKDRRYEYFVQLLNLAIKKTQAPGSSFTLKAINYEMVQGRAIQQLRLGVNLDIIWTATSKQREKELLPIRVPLLKGLLGHRVLIIRKQDQLKFSKIKSFDDLIALTAGQGHDWPDTQILRANQVNVLTTSTYQGLFRMLEAGRFDFFPRSITEAWQEIEKQNNPELTVEQHILLYYPSPIYFFVNNSNKKLALRIEKGLRIAIEDGSFDKLFTVYHVDGNIEAIDKLKQRRIFTLSNPLLPTKTPINDLNQWH